MGPGKGLAFWLSIDAQLTWADLQNATFGEWEDIQLYDAGGLAAFSIRHEGLIATRAARDAVNQFEDAAPSGDPVDPQVIDFLLRAAPNHP